MYNIIVIIIILKHNNVSCYKRAYEFLFDYGAKHHFRDTVVRNHILNNDCNPPIHNKPSNSSVNSDNYPRFNGDNKDHND